MVPGVGVEPTRPCGRRILSPLRLPVPPPRRAPGPATSADTRIISSRRCPARIRSTHPVSNRYHGGVAETAVILVDDLLFQPRIRSVLEALGFETRVADTPEMAPGACVGASIVVVDLNAREMDALVQVRAARQAGAAVLAYGRHTEPNLLRAARDAGADIVVPRSELAEALPRLVQRLRADVRGGAAGAL